VARHEKGFDAASTAELDEDELALLIGRTASSDQESREAALARFLSCSDGFADAGRSLGGSFARGGQLKDVKRD